MSLPVGPVADATAVTLYPASYALVIGIDNYSNPTWPKLRHAVIDARSVALALERGGFEMTTLIDPKASELESALHRFFIEQCDDPDARLVLWFGGHSHTIKGALGDGDYLIATDTGSSTNRSFRTSAVSLELVTHFVRQAQAKHVLTVFDSCMSSNGMAIARGPEVVPADTSARAFGMARQTISSCSLGQTRPDEGSFQRLFISTLSGIHEDNRLLAESCGCLRGRMAA